MVLLAGEEVVGLTVGLTSAGAVALLGVKGSSLLVDLVLWHVVHHAEAARSLLLLLLLLLDGLLLNHAATALLDLRLELVATAHNGGHGAAAVLVPAVGAELDSGAIAQRVALVLGQTRTAHVHVTTRHLFVSFESVGESVGVCLEKQ